MDSNGIYFRQQEQLIKLLVESLDMLMTMESLFYAI